MVDPILTANLTSNPPDPMQAAYADMLAAHLPPGLAWEVQEGKDYRRLLMGLAAAFSATHQRMLDFEKELDPRSTTELLPDWEEFLALPSPCATELPGIVSRRAAVLAKLLDLGGSTPAALIELAARYGFEIRVREFRPFRVGYSMCGEGLVGDGDPFMVGKSQCGTGLGDYSAWWTFFEVIASAYTAEYFQCGMQVGRSLGRLVNLGLECEIERAIPAHLRVIFRYETRLKPKPALVRLDAPRPLLELWPSREDDRFGDDMGFILTQTSDYTGSDWLSNPQVNIPPAWIPDLPVAELLYPYLLKGGFVEWSITGKYFSLAGAAQTIEWELLVNGAPLATPVVFAFALSVSPATLVVSPNSLITFKARLEVVGITNAQPQFSLQAMFRIQEITTGLFVYEDTAEAMPVLDGYVDQTLGFRVRRVNANGGNSLSIQSVNCEQPMRRSGG